MNNPRDPNDPKRRNPGTGLLSFLALSQAERDEMFRRVEQRQQLDEFQPQGKPN